MPVDPISALSVAAAAVQFVDFSRKLVSKSRELYNSLDGVLRDNAQTETVTMRLKAMVLELQPPRRPANSTARNASAPKASPRLQKICAECNEVSEELVDHLRRLKVPDGSVGCKWKSFRQALKSVWSKQDVDALSQRLASLRAEIDTEVLILMRDSLTLTSSQTAESLSQLNKQNQKIFENLLKTQNSQEQFIRRFELLGQAQKSEFERLSTLSINQNSKFQTLDQDTKKIISVLTSIQAHPSTKDSHPASDHYREGLRTDGIREAAATLVGCDGEKLASRVHLDILESLRFPDMTHRHDGIARAHAATFRWIFENPARYHKPWDGFSHWLCQQSGLYWIQGKPAAGKSTLMRYICHHPLTWEKLYTWSRQSRLIAGTFFFWNSGSEEQRSQSGLLRTLLYDVLERNRDLISRVFPEEWARKSDLAINDMAIAPEKWSQDRLQKAFKDLVSLADTSLKLCFFIDGLDEYDGDHGDIAEFIESLSKESPHAKFCVSSRPLPVIQQIFDGVPGLKLQDLTADDIKRYVSDKLGSDRNMQRLVQSDPKDAALLINEIVDKASGVFLWVTLVVKSLIRGLRNGDDMKYLLQRLFSLPPDIEELFGHILDKIEPEYKAESSKIFQIFRVSGNKLNILELSRALLFTEHPDAIELAIEPDPTFSTQVYREATEQLVERNTRRLDSRCRGLLETLDSFGAGTNSFEETGLADVGSHVGKRKSSVHWTDGPAKLRRTGLMLGVSSQLPCKGDTVRYCPESSNFPKDEESAYIVPPQKDTQEVPEIVYLHRTARDFLEQPEVWSRIQACTASDFDPNFSLLISYIVEVKTCPVTNVFKTGQALLKKIASLNLSATLPCIDLINEFDRILTYRSRQMGRIAHWSNDDPRWEAHPSPPPWQSDFTSFSIQSGLIWYAKAMVSHDASPAYMAAKANFALPYATPKKRGGLTLLAYAVSFHKWASGSFLQCDISLIEELLRSGSDPNEIFEGFSIWEYVIHFVHHRAGPADLGSIWLPICTLMLQHGADPHACCVEDISCFEKAIGSHPNNRPCPKPGFNSIAEHRRGCDPQSWNGRNPHAYFHSVTAVVDDVFKGHLVKDHKKLGDLVEAKKKNRARNNRKRRKKLPNNVHSPRPDWVS